MAAALDHFSDRLIAGARADLLALAKIPFIKSRTARVFWENGFRTVATISNADPTELLPVLMQVRKSNPAWADDSMLRLLTLTLNLAGPAKQDSTKGERQRQVRRKTDGQGKGDIRCRQQDLE